MRDTRLARCCLLSLSLTPGIAVNWRKGHDDDDDGNDDSAHLVSNDDDKKIWSGRGVPVTLREPPRHTLTMRY